MSAARRDDVSVWFGQITCDLFSPPVRHYTDILLNKLVPIFDDVDAEEERVAEAILSSPYWGPDNYDMAMETAYEQSRDHAIEFMEMRSVFLAVGVSGLFHLFERQLYKHLNHELHRWVMKPIGEWKDAAEILRKLTRRYDEGDPAELQRNFDQPDLTELRLVANALKHGEGKSCEALKKMNARVVAPDRLDADWTVGSFSVLNVAIAVELSDIERYRDAILAFWGTDGTYYAPRSEFGG